MQPIPLRWPMKAARGPARDGHLSLPLGPDRSWDRLDCPRHLAARLPKALDPLVRAVPSAPRRQPLALVQHDVVSSIPTWSSGSSLATDRWTRAPHRSQKFAQSGSCNPQLEQYNLRHLTSQDERLPHPTYHMPASAGLTFITFCPADTPRSQLRTACRRVRASRLSPAPLRNLKTKTPRYPSTSPGACIPGNHALESLCPSVP